MKQYTVYVVDDDSDDLEILDDVFHKSGCAVEVQLLHTVGELMQKLESHPAALPDLIVLDHQAPGTQGGEAISFLRTNSRYDGVALAVYSTHITSTKQSELKQKGVDACFAKGLTMEEVEGHVKVFCEAAGKRKENYPG